MAVRGALLDLGREGPSEASKGFEDDRPLRGGQAPDHRAHAGALVALGLRQRLTPGGRRLDQDEAPIVGDADALDEVVRLHPVDEPCRVRHRDAEELGEAAHRHRTVVLEEPQDVELAHADLALDEAAHRGAAELADPAADFCQDGVDRRLGRRFLRRVDRVGGGRLGPGHAGTSHQVKHSTDVNDSVKINGSGVAEEVRCALR